MCSVSVSLGGCCIASWSRARSPPSLWPSIGAHRHVINSFKNQPTVSQLSFFDKVRPYAFICARFYTLQVLRFVFLLPTKPPMSRFTRDAKNGHLLRQSYLRKDDKKKKKEAEEDREGRETVL